MQFMQTIARQCGVWVVALAGLVGVVQAAPPAGMAMDVKGKVEQSVNGAALPVKLLDYIQPGSQITLDAQARLSLTLYAEKKLYQFQGPATVQVSVDGKLGQTDGAEPVVKPLAERTLAAAQQTAFIPGSTRMRSAMAPVVLMSPAKGSILTEGQPEFAWASAQAGPYSFRLIGADGATVWEKTVSGQSVTLPGDVKLQKGVIYKWQVSLEKGHGKSDRGQFLMAAPEDIQAVRAAAPAAGAPIEEQVLYAVDLRDAGYVQEARKVVQQIGKTRPDLADAILSAE